MEEIKGFHGTYFFLSNFSDSKIKIGNYTFDNGEAAFHSFKQPEIAYVFVGVNPSTAKKKGRMVHLRSDWEEVKDNVMYNVVKAKFEQNPDLKEKLIATDDAYLEETNTWRDCYWGVYYGKGKNKLGEILMRVREELKMSA